MSQTNDKQVMNDSLHSRFLQSLTQTAAKMNDLVLTENGALTHASSGSALVDFNARTTELRFAEQERTIEAAAKAYDEDALLAIKLFFQIGDIRGGKGERDVFNACMDFLAEKHPEIAVAAAEAAAAPPTPMPAPHICMEIPKNEICLAG